MSLRGLTVFARLMALVAGLLLILPVHLVAGRGRTPSRGLEAPAAAESPVVDIIHSIVARDAWLLLQLRRSSGQ